MMILAYLALYAPTILPSVHAILSTHGSAVCFLQLERVRTRSHGFNEGDFD